MKSIKSQQELTKQTKSHRKLIKSQRKLKRLIKPKQTLSNTKDKKTIKLNEHNNNNDDFVENVRDLFNIVNKNELDNNNNDDFIEKIDSIRKKLNEVRHNLPKSELKEIKKYLYNIENNKLLEKNN